MKKINIIGYSILGVVTLATVWAIVYSYRTMKKDEEEFDKNNSQRKSDAQGKVNKKVNSQLCPMIDSQGYACLNGHWENHNGKCYCTGDLVPSYWIKIKK
jgi:hypothetical protein